MTFPSGDTAGDPRDQAPTPGEGGYEAPPIEQSPQSNFEMPPPPGYPGYPPPPPPGYPAYPPPPPGYQATPPTSGWGDDTMSAYDRPAVTNTNGLAIASLVSSVVGLLCGIGSLIGIILGVIALNQIKQTGQGGHGLAVAGIVVGAASMVISLAWMLTMAMN